MTEVSGAPVFGKYADAKRAAEEIRLAVIDMSSQCRCIGFTLAHLVTKLQKPTIDDTNRQLLAESGLSVTHGHHRECLKAVMDCLVAAGLVRREKRPAPHGERGTFYSTTFVTIERSLPAHRAEVQGSTPGFPSDQCLVSRGTNAHSPGDTLDTSLDTSNDDPLSKRVRELRTTYGDSDALADMVLDDRPEQAMDAPP